LARKAVPPVSFPSRSCCAWVPDLSGQVAPIYGGWMKVAHKIGRYFTAFILSLAYYLVILPFALVMNSGKTALPSDEKGFPLLGGRPEPVQPRAVFQAVLTETGRRSS
jgi:hypothetical protein